MAQPRVTRGVPEAGRFATAARAEPHVTLVMPESDRIDWQPAPEAGPEGQSAVVAGIRIAKALVRSGPACDTAYEPRILRQFDTGAVLGWVRCAWPERTWTAAPIHRPATSALACEDDAVAVLVRALAG